MPNSGRGSNSSQRRTVQRRRRPWTGCCVPAESCWWRIMWRLPVRRLGLKPPIAGGVACEVGGDVAAVNHDVLGMTFPLIVAGARSILHAQWSVDQESCGLSHIMADSRQIIWREFLRSLCKHSSRAQTVLPHNLAWLFLPFLPWCGRHGSAAMICGRKRPLTLKLASILKKMVLPDNVALSVFSHIFLRTDTQSWRKHVFGRSRHIMCQKWRVSAGKTMTFACVLSWFLPHYPYP